MSEHRANGEMKIYEEKFQNTNEIGRKKKIKIGTLDTFFDIRGCRHVGEYIHVYVHAFLSTKKKIIITSLK